MFYLIDIQPVTVAYGWQSWVKLLCKTDGV